jgi:hypothetical protein
MSIEMWSENIGSEGCVKQVMDIQRRFATIVFKTPTFAVNVIAGLEQHSRRDAALRLA